MSLKSLEALERQTTTEPPNVSIDPTSKKPGLLATFPTLSSIQMNVLDLIATDPVSMRLKVLRSKYTLN